MPYSVELIIWLYSLYFVYDGISLLLTSTLCTIGEEFVPPVTTSLS